MKNIKSILLFLSFLFISSLTVKAQGPDAVKTKVESQNYIFIAKVAIPQSGSSRQLTDRYDLTVTKDSIISYLPFFGEAYRPAIDPTKSGIKFTSTNFEYIKEAMKNNKGWQITIILKDVTDVQKLLLTVYKNGNANLDVINTNRQGISFSGNIK